MSSSSISLSSQTKEIDEINRAVSLFCPITKTPLTEAVHVHPCACKVNAIAVEGLLKKVCPVCNAPFDIFYEDYWVREVVRAAVSLNVAEVISRVCEKSADPSCALADQFYGLKEIPYPGCKQKFGFDYESTYTGELYREKGEGKLILYNSSLDDCREQCLKLSRLFYFDSIELRRFVGGSLQLKLCWDSSSNFFSNLEILFYLRDLGIDITKRINDKRSFSDMREILGKKVEKSDYKEIIFSDIHEIRGVYAILKANHEFPQKYLELMDKVIAAGE